MATYVPLQSITLNANAASVTFNNIDQTYTDLVLVVTGSAVSGNIGTWYMEFGYGSTPTFDTSSNYSSTVLYGNGSSIASGRGTSAYGVALGGWYSGIQTNQQISTVNIMNYANPSIYRNILARYSNAGYEVNEVVGTWRNNSNPITALKVYIGYGNTATPQDSFTSGSTFSLYGVSPVDAKVAQASGGTNIYYDSSYVYHVFNGTGVFTPTRNLTADVLVVAGGGSGASYNDNVAGGGGAGGLCWQSGRSLTSGSNYTVTIGAGGSGATSSSGTNGANSVFDTITAVGGGYGATGPVGSANNGGSGGGGAYGKSGGSGTQGSSGGATGYGNNGGGSSDPNYGSGGGGAGGAGGTGINSSGSGYGGVGLSGATVAALDAIGTATGAGQLYSGHTYFAGGGGGTSTNGYSYAGPGGYGGGGHGDGYNTKTGTPGTTNTGGGGGGAMPSGTAYAGYNGGSGIVVVRYAR